MIKNTSFSFVLFIFCVPLMAQTIQNGMVRELNSNRQAITNVFIEFEDAVPTTSDDNGYFRLAFANKQSGDVIHLKGIGKKGYELVNQKDFDVLKVSNNDTLFQDIILAKIGVIEDAKKQYYEVSDKALLAGFEREKEKLKEKLKITELSLEDYLDQMRFLRRQYDNQKRSLDALADRFARVNFDDVSELYKEALLLFKAGKIEECKEKLINANLLGRSEGHLGERDRIGTELNGVEKQDSLNELGITKDIESLNLKIESIKKLIEENPENMNYKDELIDAYNGLGDIYIKLGMKEEAIDFLNKNIKFCEEFHLDNPNQITPKNKLGELYLNLVTIHKEDGNKEQAIPLLTKALQIYKELAESYPNDKSFKKNIDKINLTLEEM